MRSPSPSSTSATRRPRFGNEISSTLVAVKAASDRGRAESIRDVVDAYRRLYGSVQRFVLMLTDDRLNLPSAGTSGSHSLNQLLSVLAEQARAAAFTRLRELKALVEEARPAEQLRDAIFSDAVSNDVAALRKVVAELERLDAAFVGLCVGHVLEQHARSSSSSSGDPAAGAGGRAIARRAAAVASATPPAPSPAVSRENAHAEPLFARARD